MGRQILRRPRSGRLRKSEIQVRRDQDSGCQGRVGQCQAMVGEAKVKMVNIMKSKVDEAKV